MSVPGTASYEPDFAVVLRTPPLGQPALIEVLGELDSGTCEQLLETVENQVAAGARRLTLDLRQMSFIDSAGMRALIMIERMAEQRGVSLSVTPPPDDVTELLRMAGLAERMRLEVQAHAAPTGGFIERIELELPRNPYSPARARTQVRESLSEADQSEVANVVLLTSELVTNAVVHPRGVGDAPVWLRLILYRDRVRVEVEDSGGGFERVPPVEPEGERGRGLFLVDSFADQWGHGRVQTDAGPRFRVWFETGWGQGEASAVTG